MAREVNDSKPHHVIEQVRKAANRFKNPTIACLGLTFKADVDDLRESPAMEITISLAKLGLGEILVSEPHVSELPKAFSGMPQVRLTSTADAIAKADIVLLLVNHRQYSQVDQSIMRGKVVIDTRGLWR
jgi:UDP-N-acetyl-D-mannosaminuronic acid dehydrogenase